MVLVLLPRRVSEVVWASVKNVDSGVRKRLREGDANLLQGGDCSQVPDAG